MPAFQGCVDASTGPDKDIVAELLWNSCQSCGTVYLAERFPLDVVYQSSHAGSFGSIWDNHHAALAQFVSRHGTPGSILEVGGGVGKLAAAFRNQGFSKPWTILEANPPPPDTQLLGVTFEKGFFDITTNLAGHSTIVWSHCLEHVYCIGETVAAISSKLPVGGVHIVSWPQMDAWLDGKSRVAVCSGCIAMLYLMCFCSGCARRP
jgi:hypothetical protein